MISRSVEISIAGGVVAMVRGLFLSRFFFSFFVIMRSFSLGTKSLVQR